ncbi:MAG TPA: hypothetical protein VFT95_01250 [Micromonosporaceae bacterium]|nr:hypothetical protein [Micromonosporaceae bacterium]
MEVIGRWWNGIWGRLARRDIWLVRHTSWRVVARRGDTESGRVRHWDFDAEADARRLINRLMSIEGPGRWQEQPTRTRPPIGD